MGIEFLTCPACDEVYCDVESYYTCVKCRISICSDCSDKYEEVHQDDPCICPFCMGDIVTNDMKLKEIAELIKIFDTPEFYKIVRPIQRIIDKN